MKALPTNRKLYKQVVPRISDLDDISKKLVMLLLILVIVSSVITTIAFFQVEKKVFLSQYRGQQTSSGQVQIKVVNDQVPRPDSPVSLGSGQVAIQIDK